MPAQADVCYALDASDAIVDVNGAWSAFASANGGEALLPPAILGQSVWRHLTDDTTIQIYRRVFERVRAGKGPVRFGFRCDSPGKRRMLEMAVASQPAQGLALTVRTVRVEDRAPVLLLDSAAMRTGNLLRMCAWCKRIPGADGAWLEIEEALPQLGLFYQTGQPFISHGMCETCLREMTDALEGSMPGRPRGD